MSVIMKRIAWLSAALTALCAVVHAQTGNNVIFTLMVTFGTTSYHFIMRLLVGFLIHLALNNHVNYHARWFRVSPAEQKLYQKLKVKMWKGHVPAYDPSCFDCLLHSWDEIAQATCQAELVHEVIILMSFLPVFAAIPLGAFPAFAITSFLAACFDAIFVIIQRYNRPRILKLMEKAKRTAAENRCL